MKPSFKPILVNTLVALAAVGTLALAGSLLLMPAPSTQAIEGCPNPSCGPYQYTPSVIGVSTVDCLWAKMEANADAQQYVNCSAEGVCSNQLEIIRPCWYVSGTYRVEARVKYSCASCF